MTHINWRALGDLLHHHVIQSHFGFWCIHNRLISIVEAAPRALIAIRPL